jgi:hypothetical protein
VCECGAVCARSSCASIRNEQSRIGRRERGWWRCSHRGRLRLWGWGRVHTVRCAGCATPPCSADASRCCGLEANGGTRKRTLRSSSVLPAVAANLTTRQLGHEVVDDPLVLARVHLDLKRAQRTQGCMVSSACCGVVMQNSHCCLTTQARTDARVRLHDSIVGLKKDFDSWQMQHDGQVGDGRRRAARWAGRRWEEGTTLDDGRTRER